MESLQLVLGVLRASTRMYQTNHWRVRGVGFYGQHLLLQRLYEKTFELEDSFGERLVSYFGPAAVEPKAQAEMTLAWISKWSKIADPIAQSLTVANDISKTIESAYKIMKKSGHITLGLDDLLMSTSSQIDEQIYLLQQAQR